LIRRYSSNGFYDDDRLAGGIIDLTQLGTSEQGDEEEEEVFHCEFCNNGRRMIQCKQDNNDISKGPLHKKGQYICPTCGSIKSPTNKKKEKKGPRLARQLKPFIGILSMPGNPFQTKSDDADDDDIDTFGDEYLEAYGAEIVETQTYFPESGETIVRKSFSCGS
jgi:hypothetical protein